MNRAIPSPLPSKERPFGNYSHLCILRRRIKPGFGKALGLEGTVWGPILLLQVKVKELNLKLGSHPKILSQCFKLRREVTYLIMHVGVYCGQEADLGLPLVDVERKEEKMKEGTPLEFKSLPFPLQSLPYPQY